MSSARADTRRRLLDAALRLLTEKGYFGVGMEEVAREAGVSRQALYLHFKSKADLLVAAARHHDDQVGAPQLSEPASPPKTPLEAIEQGVRAYATIQPRIYEAASMLYAVRKQEEAADAAWQDRMAYRRSLAERAIGWLANEGQLADGWTVETATDFVWALLSLHTYEYLVVERGWPIDRFVQQLTDVIKSTVVRQDVGTV